jgi:hypothetical protein
LKTRALYSDFHAFGKPALPTCAPKTAAFVGSYWLEFEFEMHCSTWPACPSKAPPLPPQNLHLSGTAAAAATSAASGLGFTYSSFSAVVRKLQVLGISQCALQLVELQPVTPI